MDNISQDVLNHANAFLEKHKVKGNVLFGMVTGSRAYNLDNKDSDTDYLGVYLFETEEFLSFFNNLPKDSLSTVPDSEGELDTTLHEVKQFVQLLIKGNPFAVQVVFTTKLCYTTKSWEELFQMRKTFLNKRTVSQFLNYCEKQRKRHERKKMPGKRTYHIVRLLFECSRIVQGLEPIVWFEDGPEREKLLDIRANKMVGGKKGGEEGEAFSVSLFLSTLCFLLLLFHEFIVQER
eukprot:TRINITY_DN2387_c0_g2_i15.p1 TRINITY_DN2387_c0_g2~~TRINITY_DN2387_c0_g2_i15.p1  ORF type:complete len:235 (+),score=37.94 TRINITY_DN2387_c0_g2_i15:178-882(+)